MYSGAALHSITSALVLNISICVLDSFLIRIRETWAESTLNMYRVPRQVGDYILLTLIM